MVRRAARGLYRKAVAIVGSKSFFFVLVGLVVLQGLWFALSFRPGLFDEAYHVDFIQAYTEQASPFITNQPESLDHLGAAERNPNYMFYYLFSWPLRFVQLFTDSYFVQVLSLRVLFLGIFVAGLFGFRALLRRLGASAALAHATLFFFVMLPVVATLAAAVNYDIVILALLPFILILLIDVLKSSRVEAGKVFGVVALSLFAVLMKFTFIAFLVPIVLCLLFGLLKNHGRSLFGKLWRSFRAQKKLVQAGTIAALLLMSGLIIERPVMNALVYESPFGRCENILSEDRCSANYISVRNMTFLENKPDDFAPLTRPAYFVQEWVPTMALTTIQTYPGTDRPFVLKLLLHGSLVLAAVVVALNLHVFLRNRRTRLIIIIAAFYVVVLFVQLYGGYVRLGQPVAISARYLIPVLPLAIYLVLMGLRRLAGRKYASLLATACVLAALTLLTQGGGVTTHLLTANDYQWEDNIMTDTVNPALENTVRKAVR